MIKVNRLKFLFISLLLITLSINSAFASNLSISDDETVYAITRPDGSLEKTVVVDWIRVEGDGEYAIYDGGKDLNNVRKLLGDASVSFSDSRVKIEGRVNGISDIYYRGETKKPLPLSLNITYYLNGKKTTYQNALDKKGTLRIEFTVKNRLQKRVRIGNDEEDVYVPFTAILNASFPSSRIRDIKISEGGSTIVAGSNINVTLMGMPQPDFKGWLEVSMDKIELSPLQIAVIPSSPALAGLLEGLGDYIGSIEQMDQVLKFQQDLLKQMSQEIKVAIDEKGNSIETSLDNAGKMDEILGKQEGMMDDMLKATGKMIDRNNRMRLLAEKMEDGKELLALLEEEKRELEGMKEKLTAMKGNNRELRQFFSLMPVDGIREIMNSLSRIQMSLNAIAEGGFVGFVMIPGINMVRDGIKTAKEEIEKNKERMDVLEGLARNYDTFTGKPGNAKKSSVRFIYYIKFE